MALRAEHEVVADAYGVGLGEDDLEFEERIGRSDTAHVEVHVNATIAMENEVADGISALDVVFVAVVSGEEP